MSRYVRSRHVRFPTQAARLLAAALACAVSVAALGACASPGGGDAPRAAAPADRAAAAGARRGGSPTTLPGSDVDPTLNGVSM